MSNVIFLNNPYSHTVTSLFLKDLFCLKHVCIYLFIISFSGIHANNFEKGSVQGSLIDEQNEPVPFASIVLKNTKDSSFYKNEISNDQGKFVFDLVKEGNYFIQIRMVGFETFLKSDIVISEQNSEINIGIIQLKRSSNHLKEVNIVSEKPFIEKLPDRTVVNIENSILSTGSTALGVMEKLPGVQVSDQGIISLKGKSTVSVIIDGKTTMLSADNLATLLRGMPSSSIQKIEIITNPSSKYDAAGSAGIINIITKKNKKEGINGNVNIGYGQGRYEKGNAGFDLSMKNKWCNLFLNYNFSHRKEYLDFKLVRDFPIQNNPNSIIVSNSYAITPNNNHSPRLGADIYISKRTTLSIIGSGLFYGLHSINSSNSDILSENKKIISYDFINDLKASWNNYTGSVHLVHQLDTNRREVSFDLDYANYLNKVNQINSIISRDENGNFKNEALSSGDQNAKLHIYSAKIDYSQPLNKQIFMETGLKSSYVYSNSDNTLFNKTQTELIYDSTRSNHFVYSENINATYINLKSEFKKVTFQSGIRGEQTIIDGEQLLTKQKIKKSYIKLFPTASVSYKVNENNECGINLSKRINRPPYQMLDPFRLLTDVGTYSQGNPNLNPEITYTCDLNYSYHNTFFITVGYSFIQDRIISDLIHDPDKEITLRTPVNLGQSHFYTLDLTYAKKLTSWWNTNSTFIPYYQRFSGKYNDYAIYNNGAFTFWFNTNNTFYLIDGLSMECNFNYQYINPNGISINKPIYNLNAGIKKMLFNKRGSLTINMNDVLRTNYVRGVAHFGTKEIELISNFRAQWDSRVLNVTFSYRFGKGPTGKIRRISGAEDEKNRINVH